MKVGAAVGVCVAVGVGVAGTEILCRWIKMSEVPLKSLRTRFVAKDWKAIYSPSAEINGVLDELSACVPAEATETRFVAPVCISWTKTSLIPFVSPETRFEAYE